MKLTKIRFTAWRDQSSPRSLALQEQLDACTARVSLLSAAATQLTVERTHADSEMLRRSFARLTAEQGKIAASRTLLLADEEAAAHAASRHEKVGTFGYQVLNDTGTHVGYIVDESGNHLPAKAVYSYEVVDDDPPVPRWARDVKVGH